MTYLEVEPDCETLTSTDREESENRLKNISVSNPEPIERRQRREVSIQPVTYDDSVIMEQARQKGIYRAVGAEASEIRV